ncbi:MAG: FKBP-type peptidyl-prolyl cis-trans isomerase [Phycisphaeraceae bacterium]
MKLLVPALLLVTVLIGALVWAQNGAPANPAPTPQDPAPAAADDHAGHDHAPGVAHPVESPEMAAAKAAVADLTTPEQKISYAIGMDVAQSMKGQFVAVEPEVVARGVRDGLAGKEMPYSQQEMQAIMMELQKQAMAKHAAIGEQNKAAGEAFLAKNKTEEGVVTTKSGLQYKVVTEGKGENPKPENSVTVHYEGKLLDGTVFDSSMQRGKPETFGVGDVIEGWQEALQLMKPGARYKLWIPSELAYKERGGGAKIGAHAVLVFEVELIKINP